MSAAVLLTMTTFGATPADAQRPTSSTEASAPTCAVDPKLVPQCGGRVLAGAYVAPINGETPSAALRRFESKTAAAAEIVHIYKRGAALFPSSAERAMLTQDGRSRLVLANWKVAPELTWRQIADGRADARIDAEAAYLKANYQKKMFLIIQHEPEDEVRQWDGSGFRAQDYADMYRHVVDRLRSRGAVNLVFVVDYMGAQKWALVSWYSALYPGDSYVDWLAFDPYKTPGLGGQEGLFDTLVNQYWGNTAWRGAYDWAHRNHPSKPVMLAEWGVGEKPGAPAWKGQFFDSAVGSLPSYPMLKALVYLNSPSADVAGNTSVDTSALALTGYRHLLDSPALAPVSY